MAETKIYTHSLEPVLTKKHLQDLSIERLSASQVDINSGLVGNDDGTVIMEVGSTITVDITASGANGLDTGSEASDTWYYIWLICNLSTNTVAGLFSTSSSSPTMPSGYTKKRLIGVVRNDSSSNFLPFVQMDRQVFYIRSYNVLSSGAATSWTGVIIDNYVPDIAFFAELSLYSYYGVSGNSGWYYVGWASGYSMTRMLTAYDSSTNEGISSICMKLPFVVSGGSRYLYYYNSNTSTHGYIYIVGFTLQI